MNIRSRTTLGLTGLLGALVLPLSLAVASDRPDCRQCTDDFNECANSADWQYLGCIANPDNDPVQCDLERREAYQGCNDGFSKCWSDCTY